MKKIKIYDKEKFDWALDSAFDALSGKVSLDVPEKLIVKDDDNV
ncbi:hypothetical protein RON44_00330 [Lactobacillus gasseri]|jgi:hypothetical protein|uniref:Uncharacterized protein n=2 Tax=Lactobacillus TaxID=1578 RepID=A0ABY3BDB7_LACGS|nr:MULTISPECIES: hypothetical protein [Lactobacillus]DAV22932.1 MAG TPA: hypothetical protein [Caudoviricetes sp.]KXA27996.1 hypothetical protein HMPREF3210_00244 [Lactobacillus gasseri]MDK6500083.1 hypothetical protein [Lactobacillus gasseri]MDK6868419.1 hypothetical protein [Lactobacillus paragasseri]MDT9621445.1 hypothetical protein [Lactobacillus gasseri]